MKKVKFEAFGRWALTDCPYIQDKAVAAEECIKCEHFGSINERKRIVFCNYPHVPQSGGPNMHD